MKIVTTVLIFSTLTYSNNLKNIISYQNVIPNISCTAKKCFSPIFVVVYCSIRRNGTLIMRKKWDYWVRKWKTTFWINKKCATFSFFRWTRDLSLAAKSFHLWISRSDSLGNSCILPLAFLVSSLQWNFVVDLLVGGVCLWW